MRHAIDILPAGNWPESDCAGTVTLVFSDRHRRRIRMTDDTGEPFLLDLPQAALLADGDGLKLDEGGIVRVVAAAEAVCDVICETPEDCARIAWHIGNRHTPVQVLGGCTLRIQDDHVLVHMVEGLGAKVLRHKAPFAPEPGAYAAPAHGHDHDH